MVCIPCIVIPFVLWLFHKYIQPIILKFWNPWEKKSVEDKAVDCSPDILDPAMADSKEKEYIQKMIKENPVMMFSKTTCSYCAMAKEVLDGIGVSYVVEEIDLRKDCDQLQNVFKQLTGAKTATSVCWREVYWWRHRDVLPAQPGQADAPT